MRLITDQIDKPIDELRHSLNNKLWPQYTIYLRPQHVCEIWNELMDKIKSELKYEQIDETYNKLTLNLENEIDK